MLCKLTVRLRKLTTEASLRRSRDPLSSIGRRELSPAREGVENGKQTKPVYVDAGIDLVASADGS